MAHDEMSQRLEAAVEQGIISAMQADAIRALGRDAADGPEPSVDGGFVAALLGQRRGISAAAIAYSLGAMTVIGAMGWFLSEQWRSLGGWGVLAVLAVYAALFTLTERVMRREGFATAAGLAVLLLVTLAPIAVFAIDDITHWFSTDGLARSCRYPDFVFWACRGEEVVAELVTAAAALVALRRVRFGLLVAPIALVALRLLFHVSHAIHRGGLGDATTGWTWAIGASALAAVAYAVDRAQRGDEDFAFWLHCVAAASALGATFWLTEAYPVYRHLLVPGAFVAFALALTLRRRPWMLLGSVWFAWYVIWLASEVFSRSPSFPIVLAALGLGMIIATVWVQRNADMLARRFGTVSADGRPRFPGGVPLLLAPLLVALLMMGDGVARDREARAEQAWREVLWRRRMVREAADRRATERGEAERRPPRPPRETVPPR